MSKRGRYAIPITTPEKERARPPMITVRIPIDQYNQVVSLSRSEKKSLNTICLEALAKYINERANG